MSGSKSVLVLEDEPLVAMLFEDLLIQNGYLEAGVVGTIDEALEQVSSSEFDMAIVDVSLHGKYTFPVAEQLIQRKLPFVFATGYGSIIVPDSFKDVPVLTKPFSEDDLKHILAKIAQQPAS